MFRITKNDRDDQVEPPMGNSQSFTITGTPNVSHKPLTNIPGGFYQAGPLKGLQRNSAREVEPMSTVDDSSRAFSDNSYEDSFDTSNARLANFFKEKGNQPLSDIEIEGVLSLMQKSRASSVAGSVKKPNANSSFRRHGEKESRILRSSTCLSASDAVTKQISFYPDYQNMETSQDTSANTVRKHIYDYSNAPTPFKTVVYKYSAASTPHLTKPIKDDESSLIANPPSSHKKLSNTATALISLMESESMNAGPQDQTINDMANPYSTHVEKVNTFRKPTATKNTLKDIDKLDDLKNTKDDVDEPNNKTTDLSNEKFKPSTEKSKENFKPSRPSTLGSNVVIAKHSPKKVAENADYKKDSTSFLMKNPPALVNKETLGGVTTQPETAGTDDLINSYENARAPNGDDEINASLVSQDTVNKKQNILNTNSNSFKAANQEKLGEKTLTTLNPWKNKFRFDVKLDIQPRRQINHEVAAKYKQAFTF